MKCKKIIYVILLSFLIVYPLSADQFELKNIFPEKMEDQGWKAEEEPFVAIDENALSMIINGAAPQYFELGTKKAGFANYEKGDVYLMLEIYETVSKNSAKNYLKNLKLTMQNLWIIWEPNQDLNQKWVDLIWQNFSRTGSM